MKKMKMILPCLILSLTTLSTLVSCDGGNSTSDVNEIVLDSISLKTKPTKLTYTEGEKLDTTGMEVIAKYSDNSTKAVTGYKVDKVEPLTVSDTTVVVSYTEAKVTKTCNFDITVNYREPIVIPIQGETRYEFNVIAGYGKIQNAKVTSTAGVGSYITDFSWDNNSSATLNVFSDAEAQCDFVIKMRKTADIITLTSQVSVVINGEVLESEAEVGGSLQGATAEFDEVNLGQFYLEAGNNVIEIKPQSTISNFDFMSVIFYTDSSANLRWNELKDVKGEIFYGIEDYVEIEGAYRKNLEENCIGCAAYTPSSANFPIYASRENDAKIYIIQSGMPHNNVLTDYYNFTINDVRQESTAMTNYTDGYWGDYKIIEIGTYRLASGLNNIKFAVGDVSWDNSFNIRGIIVETDAKVAFTEVDAEDHVCLDVCPDCGGCLNETCEEEACSTKCSCVHEETLTYTFKSDDSRVEISPSLIKSRGCIEVIDYNANNVVTYNLYSSKAATAELSFNISGNPHANWTFVDYFKVFVNDVQLSKDEYKALTKQISYQEFYDVVLGNINLNEGNNKIEVRYSCAGNYAESLGIGQEGYRFDIKSMSLTSNSKITFSEKEQTFKAVDSDVTGGSVNLNEDCVGIKAIYNESGEFTGEYETTSIKYTLNSTENAKIKLYTTISRNIVEEKITDVYKMKINGVEKHSNAKSVIGNLWTDYDEIYLGEYDVVEGENTIEFAYKPTIDNSARSYNFRGIKIASTSNIAWKTNNYVFNAIDDQVIVNSNLNKNVDNNYVEVASDYGMENTLTFNITSSKATKANISFTVSANPMAQWSFVDYFRVWYNAGETKDASTKLSKAIYKAHTQQGDYNKFVTVNLGEFDLLEGDNEIVLGFACAGNAAYRFYVRDLQISTRAVLAYK